MPHLPFLAVAAFVVAVSTWLIAGPSSRVITEFEFTGSPQDYVVPPDVCRVRIDVVGAAGGPEGTAGAPGVGAKAVADFEVMPGETLRVRVGGWGGEAVGSKPGAGGWNGGGTGGEALDSHGKAGSGGGGATDVRRGGDGLADRIIVAAGGSGGAGGGIGGPIGGGGEGGLNGEPGLAVVGSANPATGGQGGTQTTGGAPGRNASNLSVTATTGSLGLGGHGAAGVASGGGGGGGGLYGGGGGGSSRVFSGGHGGGGSGFGPAETVFRAGVGVGPGHAKISYAESSC